VFAAAVLLHMVWDSPLQLPLHATFVILGVAGWVIVLGLVQEGLEELRSRKAAAILENPASSATIE
jgi:RsiW-degrading membrane proteinase PrsW (M82 family)